MSLFQSRTKLQKRVQTQFKGFFHRRFHTQTSQIQPPYMNPVSILKPNIKSIENKKTDFTQSRVSQAKFNAMYLDILFGNLGHKSKIRKINFCLQKKQSIILNENNSTNFLRKEKSKRKKISFAVPNSRTSIANQLCQANQQPKEIRVVEELDTELLKIEVRKICESLEELRNFGLGDKKLNSWCKSYFDSKKKTLIDIFMKKYVKKKSLNDELTFVVISKEDELLSQVMSVVDSSTQKQRQSLGVEISLYRTFLEDKIANKQRLQLNQLENRVKSNILQPQSKQLARQLYKEEINTTELASFYTDMQRVEQAYGPLTLISIKNRKRYENINKSEVNIRKIIYD